jgi:leucine dehydrogenase
MIFDQIKSDAFEQVIFCQDQKVGLKGIIAIHSSVLGPATGGCRMWNYANDRDAFEDVLRLSKGMTYKAAVSGLNWGGGKAIIIGDPKTEKSTALLARFGEFVDRLNGNYITAKDVGIDAEDLRKIKTKTKHVLGIKGDVGSSGDPSPGTALGVFHGMRACLEHVHQTKSFKGITVALQGLGSVSYCLLHHLMSEGAEVVGCDIDSAMIDRAVKEFGIGIVEPEKIYDVACDIFSPSALGGAISAETLPRIKSRIIAGAANNQLVTPAQGFEIMKRGMTYAPDYAINAGGLINIYYEDRSGNFYDGVLASAHIKRIEGTIANILQRSKEDKQPTFLVADRIAEERITQATKR